MTIIYSVRSLRHIKAIYDYIAQNDPAAADRTVQRIREATRRLQTLFYSGRPGPHGTRILSVSGLPYVVIHRVRGDTVDIVAVFHTARNRRA